MVLSCCRACHSSQTVAHHSFKPNSLSRWMEGKWGKWVPSFLCLCFEWRRIAEGWMLSGVSECSCWPLKEFSRFLQPCCAAFIFNQRFGREQRVTSEEILTRNIFFPSLSFSLLQWVCLGHQSWLFASVSLRHQPLSSKLSRATLTCPGVKPTPPAGVK